MAQDKKQVEQITDMEVDFAKWFTDVCKKAELIDYSSIKGMFILRPYGYAIWENFQKILDEKFKETGHENVYLPMLIPESLLQKEKDHVEGFAPECAWVTMGGSEKLEERYPDFDVAAYGQKHFGMYSGEEASVTLRCRSHMAGVVWDRFGQDVILVPEDEDHFTVTLPLVLSPQFFGWLFGLEDNVELIAPQKAAEEYRRKLKAVLEQYG